VEISGYFEMTAFNGVWNDEMRVPTSHDSVMYEGTNSKLQYL